MVSRTVLMLGGALALAILVILALVVFYQPFALGSGNPLSLKLGPGNCIDEASCRKYCEENLQDCIEWCTTHEHPLCEAITNQYLPPS